MANTRVDPIALCPDSVHGTAMCSYCVVATKNRDGKLDDGRRKNILNALSSIELRLTEEESGRCLAYFDHFNRPEFEN
jgi:hypothetical protein